MTIGLLGQLVLGAAFCTACYGALASVIGWRRRLARLTESARTAAYPLLGLVFVAVALMVIAILGNDFTIRYVAENSSLETPTFFKVLSLWSADEGSLLLWSLVLCGYIATAAWAFRDRRPTGFPIALSVLHGSAAFYLLLVLGPTQPFAELARPPIDGTGPLPLLQNHPLMAAHPPLLYLGFVGCTVPFALVIGALVQGDVGDGWLRSMRRWSIIPWVFLTTGLVLGALWSYGVLGWGGYWAWDPVENAALMPWLTLTALLHAIRVQERRRALRVWTQSLVVVTFASTVLGTFLTRGSILLSVHSFARSAVGPLYLAYLSVVLIGGLGLVAARAGRSSPLDVARFGPSRESAIVVNNVLLVVLMVTVLVGTVYPLLEGAVGGRQVSVGAPYFQRTTGPAFLALVALMGVGPLMAWRSASVGRTLDRAAVPAVAAALTGVWLTIHGLGGPMMLLAYGVIAFAAASALVELARAVRSGRRRSSSVQRLMGNVRLAGALIAHLGIAVAAGAILTSSAFGSQRDVTVSVDQVRSVGRYDLRLDQVAERAEPERRVVVAALTVSDGGHTVARLDPSLNLYPNATQPIGSPSIRLGTPANSFVDLYASLLAYRADGSTVTIRLATIPGVMWLWIGGAMTALGGLVAGLARVTRRTAPAPVPGVRRTLLPQVRV